MWLYTKDGFYSVVHDQYCKTDEVMIRARKRIDLENLSKHNIKGEIIKIDHADYRYRMPVKRQSWSSYLSAYTENLEYSNFKNTLSHKDKSRHDAYFKCWDAMYTFQNS